MVYTPHEPVKAEKLVNQYIGLVERQLIVPQLFARKGIEDFVGAEGDAVTVKVPGRLPARRYAFRNDRTNPIKLDIYKERKITTTFGDLIYSGSPITDEQKDFDGVNPSSLLPVQSRAVATELNQICVEELESAPFPVTLGGFEVSPKTALIQARKIFNQLRQPEAGRFMLVGSDFEAALLSDEKLRLMTSPSGLGNAAPGNNSPLSAIQAASIGASYGITFIRSDEIATDAAYLLSPNAFILLTGAPSVPASVGQGATTSYNGLSLRWMQDYDFMYRTDRSSVDTYVGTQTVTDVFLRYDKTTLAGDTTHKGEIVGSEDHFVRGIKLTLSGTSTGPALGGLLDLDTRSDAAVVGSGVNATTVAAAHTKIQAGN